MKWEYLFYVGNIVNKGMSSESEATNLTSDKNRNGFGKNDFDIIQEYGEQEWELISVTPISNRYSENMAGQTRQLLFTFKKAKK